MRNNRGVTAVSAVLTIMILFLLVFLAYEVFYIDLFNLFGRNENASVLANITTGQENALENVEVASNGSNVTPTTPITNNNLYRKRDIN